MAVQFRHGDLVFGKVRGYPPWPARVDETLMPELKVTANKVPVFFFGTHEIGILAPKDVCFYSRHKKTLGVPQKRTGFNRGMYEIRHTPDLKLEPKNKTEHGPSSEDDEFPPSKKLKLDNDDENSVTDENMPTEDSAAPKKNGVSVSSSDTDSSSDSDSSSSNEESSNNDDSSTESFSDKSWTEESDRRKVIAPRKSKSKCVISHKMALYADCRVKRPTHLLQTKVATSVSKLNDLGGKICSPTDVRETVNAEHEILQLKINSKDTQRSESIPLLKTDKSQTEMAACATPVDSQDETTSFKTNGKEKDDTEEPSNGYILEKVASNSTKMTITAQKANHQRPKHQMEVGEHIAVTDTRLADKIKNKIARKEAEKEIKKKEKYERKKREKCLLLRSEIKLRALDLRIKESLSVVKQDIAKCLDAMEKMDTMDVTPLMLKKNPDIVVTLRKCCRFKNSDQIRLKAEYLYNKFKSMFLVGEGETFSLVFRRDTQCLKEMADRIGRDVADMTEDTLPSEKPSFGKTTSTTARCTANEFPET